MFLKLFLLQLTLVSCFSKLHQISKRELGLADQAQKKAMEKDSKFNKESKLKNDKIYAKNSKIVIDKSNERETSISLFNPDSDRSYLYSKKPTPTLGDTIPVMILPTKTKDTSLADKNKKQGPPGSSKTDPNQNEKNPKEKDLEALEAAFPSLDSFDLGPKNIIDGLTMKVAYVYPNGDLLLNYTRESLSDEKGKKILVQAKVPYANLLKETSITSNELFDVSFLETQDDEIIERSSTNWQDEYSLRISGFTEASSKYATKLEEKSKELKEFSDKLHQNLQQFKKERETIAKERDLLILKNRTQTDEIDLLKKRVEDQSARLNENIPALQTSNANPLGVAPTQGAPSAGPGTLTTTPPSPAIAKNTSPPIPTPQKAQK